MVIKNTNPPKHFNKSNYLHKSLRIPFDFNEKTAKSQFVCLHLFFDMDLSFLNIRSSEPTSNSMQQNLEIIDYLEYIKLKL